MQAIIKLNKATKNHPDLLKSLGYTTDTKDGLITIECNGFIETEVDLTNDPKATLKELITRKFLLTYSTRFRTPQGIRYGVPATKALDNIAPGLSCLIAQPIARHHAAEAKKTEKANRPTLSEFLSL